MSQVEARWLQQAGRRGNAAFLAKAEAWLSTPSASAHMLRCTSCRVHAGKEKQVIQIPIKKGRAEPSPKFIPRRKVYFFTGSSGFAALPSM